jgi:hypothetical protein
MSGAWRQVPRYLNILLSVLNLALFAAGFYFVASRGFTPGPGWTPVELVTAVLAALAILITILGIFLAILAFWGYTGIARLQSEPASFGMRILSATGAREPGWT